MDYIEADDVHANWPRAATLGLLDEGKMRRSPLFSAWSRARIIEGHKTETRRVITDTTHRYGKPGDIWILREPLMRCAGHAVYSDGKQVFDLLDQKPVVWRWKRDSLAAMFMPKTMGRVFLAFVYERAERLQEIDEQGACKEGALPYFDKYYEKLGLCSQNTWTRKAGFARVWDQINAERGYRWQTNPMVRVMGFEITQQAWCKKGQRLCLD